MIKRRFSLLVLAAFLILGACASVSKDGKAAPAADSSPAPGAAAAGAPKELLHNPGFEGRNGKGSTLGYSDHWAGCKLKLVDDPVHSGNWACMVSKRTQFWDGLAYFDTLKLLKTGKSYKITAWLRMPEDVEDHNFYMQFDYIEHGKEANYPMLGEATLITSKAWTQIGGIFTLNNKKPLDRLMLYICSADENLSDFVVDDLSITETTETTASSVAQITELPTKPNAVKESEAWINYADTKQKIDGFGVSCAWNTLEKSPKGAEAMDLLFDKDKGIGLDILRSMITPTMKVKADSPIDWASESGQAWMIKEAAKRGATKFMATVWSPPVWMKDNDNKIKGSVKPEMYQAYADFLSEYARGYKKATGQDLYAISMSNEPTIQPLYDGCKWTAKQIHDFILNNVKPTFAKDNVQAKFMAAEDMNFTEQLLKETLLDPAAASRLDIAAVHGYSNGFTPLKDAVVQGKPVWMTEILGYYQEDTGIRDGLVWAKRIARHMGEVDVSAWNYWWAAGQGNGYLLSLDSDNVLSTTKRYWAVGAYSKVVRPGWYRISATLQPNKDVFLTAFKDEPSKQAAFVLVNTNVNDQVVSIHLNGFKAPSFKEWRTSDKEDMAALPDAAPEGNILKVTIPAQSYETFLAAGVESAAAVPVTTEMKTVVEQGVIATAKAVRGTPVVDGAEDPIWAAAPSYKLDVWGDGTNGTANGAVEWKAMWDDKNVYILAKVDKQGMKLSKKSLLTYYQDSFESFIEESDAKNVGAYEADCAHYNVTYDGTVNHYSDFDDKVNFKAKTAVSDTSYVIEEAIPLHRAVKAGDTVGLELQINIEIAQGKRNILKWATIAADSYFDPSTFGDLKLVDKAE
jgi:glucuronoarabinoxylan endo-1,4-beta-xylanase